MADKKRGAADPRAVPSSSVPPPPVSLAKLVKTVPWPQGRIIHRIHLNLYGGSEFNPGIKGNARFSPIQTAEGASIPTLYGGTTFECAAMETVFHDVPVVPGLKTFDKQKLVGQMYSTVTPRRSLALADLSSTALRRLGLRRGELIDTEKDQYPGTRRWAEAIHAECPAVEGLCWVSRQDDRGLAIVLFGDRVAPHDLVAVSDPRSVVADVEVYSILLVLAERIGVNVVGGR
jgi:hypothetical protein